MAGRGSWGIQRPPSRRAGPRGGKGCEQTPWLSAPRRPRRALYEEADVFPGRSVTCSARRAVRGREVREEGGFLVTRNGTCLCQRVLMVTANSEVWGSFTLKAGTPRGPLQEGRIELGWMIPGFYASFWTTHKASNLPAPFERRSGLKQHCSPEAGLSVTQALFVLSPPSFPGRRQGTCVDLWVQLAPPSICSCLCTRHLSFYC